MMGSSREHTKIILGWSAGAVIAVMLTLGLVSFGGMSEAHADDMFKKGPNGQYEIQTSVWFPSNAKRFRPQYRARLKKIAAFLKKHPEIKLVQLIGHADSRGNSALNKRLSGVRARYVKDTLVGMGVKADRLQIVASGADESGYNNKNPRGRGMNRRVDFMLVYGDVPEPAKAQDTPEEVEDDAELAETAEAEAAPEESDDTEALAEGDEEAGEDASQAEEALVEEADPEAEAAIAEEGEAEEAVEDEQTDEPAEETDETPGDEEQPAELEAEGEAEPLVEETVEERIELPTWLDFLEPHVNVAARSDLTHWVQDNPHWIAAGITSAALLTAVALDVTGIGHALESHNLVAGSNDAQANAEALKDYRAGTLIFYAVAAASAAGSAWLYLDEYMSLLEPEPETSIQLVPTEGGAMLNLQMPLLGD